MRTVQGLHLTYCSNVHAVAGWSAVREAVIHHASALKARLSPDAPFGLGLRLSASESAELLMGDRLSAFATELTARGLYVLTMNGFPYGSFHGEPVKAGVFAPDWRDPARVAYTLRLAEIMAGLLRPGQGGGISTVPLSYRAWVRPDDEAAWRAMTRHVVCVVHGLVRLRESCGARVHLDLEPEPDGLLETSAEVAAFFERWLLPVGGPLLASALNTSAHEAHALLLDHVRVCLDACHLAVAYEDPAAALARLAEVGVRLGKVQLSSALRLAVPPDAAGRSAVAERLAPFAESTYLHQVVERLPDGSLRHHPDLAVALPNLVDTPAVEWRVHFHVPIFLARAGVLGTTQDTLSGLLALVARQSEPPPLEIETYTWGVLPSDLRGELVSAIAREYQWAVQALAAPSNGRRAPVR